MAMKQANGKGAGKGKQGGHAVSHVSVINSRLISVAKIGSLDTFLKTVAEDLPRMNLVNLSTALHRLAKLTSASTRDLVKQNATFDVLLATVRNKLAIRQPRPVPQPQALSNIAWALATIQHVDLPLLEACVSLAVRQVSGFKPFEMSPILWAFATFKSLDPAACACATPFFQAASKSLLSKLTDYSFRCLVMTLWAFATAGHHDAELLASIARQMSRIAHTANRQDLCNAAKAFSHAGFSHESFFKDLPLKQQQQQEQQPQQHGGACKRSRTLSECSTNGSSFSSEDMLALDGHTFSPSIGSERQSVNKEGLNVLCMQHGHDSGSDSSRSISKMSTLAGDAEDAHCIQEKPLSLPLNITPKSSRSKELVLSLNEHNRIAGMSKEVGEPKYIRLEDLACKPPMVYEGEGRSRYRF
eukprot:TRINITY_DN5066_c0_g2_i1.p1 TRINITY_DN5066_c0_g2~~TRINITY_DN5066_c0_g2_i1.p1  ORF type:complete len:415 (-),score=70.11 TRINITY_DN5066_c0_g2_i1:390-1634(-)